MSSGMPECFGAYRSPQSDAENCCTDCSYDNICVEVYVMNARYKNNYALYESEKSKLQDKNLSTIEYQKAVIKLANRLGV